MKTKMTGLTTVKPENKNVKRDDPRKAPKVEGETKTKEAKTLVVKPKVAKKAVVYYLTVATAQAVAELAKKLEDDKSHVVEEALKAYVKAKLV